ncbi:MAG: hypothetical protein Q8P67_16170 [archaeon]|nr:hypothetical protein [archaeon]
MGTISDTTAKWSSLAMGVFGIGLTLVCMGFLAQILWQFFSRGKGPRSPGEIVSLLIKAMLPWAPLARALDCLLFDNELVISPVSDQPWSAVFLGTIPGFLYVILYLLLVFFWGWLYVAFLSSDF